MKNVLKNKKALLLAGGVVGVLVLGGGGVAVASTLGDDRIGGQAADQAKEAALAETGGGTVTDVDRLDDGLPGYEVDVVLPDGRESTVLLGDDFGVTSSRVDDDDRSGDDRSGRDGSGRDDRAGSDDRGGDDRGSDDDSGDNRSGRDGRGDDDLSDDSTATPGSSSTSGSASSSDDELVGADYDQAAAASIAAAGGGTVTDADRSDDGDVAYEVDVRLDDGTEVDVDLDASFAVLRTDVDDRR
ncbi:PepSY domain-containing protein [Frigoribacterium faeni]|uniref:PepSY domain-containing protein n=1 Tax=Frigoribacterium faeni TaxID=145483 RepID=UPI001ABAA7A8|nr:PepSY domain-containing protein [Frigoribacterium faeni]NIJ04729.1 putative membrane protein YkoI [Frigoribacterium faeni]